VRKGNSTVQTRRELQQYLGKISSQWLIPSTHGAPLPVGLDAV